MSKKQNKFYKQMKKGLEDALNTIKNDEFIQTTLITSNRAGLIKGRKTEIVNKAVAG